MLHRLHAFPDLLLLGISFLIQLHLGAIVLADPRWRTKKRVAAYLSTNLALAAVLLASYLTGFHIVWRYVPNKFCQWLDAAGLVLSIVLIGLYLGILLWRTAPRFAPQRRRLIKTAAASLVAAPYVVTSLGVINRFKIGMSEVSVRIPNLPRDLDGLRLVQVTDIHLSPFLSEKEFARAIDMANETRAHIALVTGDLISRRGDPLDACLRQLSRLRADAGVLGCLGNHEVYTGTEDYVTEQGKRIGIDFLRNTARVLRFGSAMLNFAGVDYQQFNKPYLRGAEKLISPGATNVLLSHNPDVFPTAASQGYDLTIAGHTHGGQVNFEILHENVNIALYYTHFVRGLYRRGDKSVYVGSGLGTIGVPVRLGAPAEISVIRLCAS